MDTYIKLGPLGLAALEGLIAGAGIAIFFALGLRGLAMRTGDETGDIGADLPGTPGGATAALGGRRNPAGLVLAVLCFAVVVAIVVVGLYVMVTSK